jgi:hypothetical protein
MWHVWTRIKMCAQSVWGNLKKTTNVAEDVILKWILEKWDGRAPNGFN